MLRQLFEAGGENVPEILRPEELEKYEAYLALLTEWNEKMSLVSPKSLLAAFGTHFVDSIQIIDAAEPFERDGIYDLGTGAGFPGIVHAIRYPDRPIRLYERSVKKQTFLAEVITRLSLNNVELDGEFPEKGRLSGVFFARAVLPRDELLRFFARLVQPGSVVVSNLGGQADAVSVPSDFTVEAESRYTLPQDCGDRRVQILRFVPRGTNRR